MLLAFSALALFCAAIPALLYVWNTLLFRPPCHDSLTHPRGTHGTLTQTHGALTQHHSLAISVLIPARNEEGSIALCVQHVLASQDVDLEVIVLDDHSTDRTTRIVHEIATKDSRVRLDTAPPLPEGWCGKQHACFVLAQVAQHPILSFLDADVRLKPDALARMAEFLQKSKAGLVSGFPQQETGTLLEKLVIPLINWLLLAYLPMIGMRRTREPGFGVGCGQWFMTTREAYDAVGGHESVKSSLHDGLTLPRAYRRADYQTDICDATNLATCRMYRSAGAVWFGLAKNAREGMAATPQIVLWTAILLCGQVLPFLLLPFAAQDLGVLVAPSLAFLPRWHSALRFRQSWLGAILHPIGVLTLLMIQWFAVFRAAIGRPVGWKGRHHPVTRPGPLRLPGLPCP